MNSELTVCCVIAGMEETSEEAKTSATSPAKDDTQDSPLTDFFQQFNQLQMSLKNEANRVAATNQKLEEDIKLFEE